MSLGKRQYEAGKAIAEAAKRQRVEEEPEQPNYKKRLTPKALEALVEGLIETGEDMNQPALPKIILRQMYNTNLLSQVQYGWAILQVDGQQERREKLPPKEHRTTFKGRAFTSVGPTFRK